MKPSAQKLWTSKVYDRIVAFYDAVFERLFPGAMSARRRVIEDWQTGTILDVGCGTGSLLSLACANGLVCYGLDMSRGMLLRSQARVPAGKFVRGSYYQLPYPDNTFAYVTETHALGGTDIDIACALKEMLRVCRPGGEVRLVDYVCPSNPTWPTRLIAMVSSLVGDEPRDFVGVFQQLGYEPDVEVLGWSGMYQLLKVRKTR
jgi:ubiquinone/menaquinone biosynthesis C-methylase UbiE